MMFRTPGRTGAGFALIALLVLAACQRGPEKPPPACPVIAIVEDTAELTLFTPGPGRDLIDVTLEAKVAEFGGFCNTDIDEDEGTGEVKVDLEVLFQATRGPASISRTAKVSYFIAIADRNENILARETFESEVEFEGNRNRIAYVEELKQKIPLKAGKLGDDFKIFIGFQLNDEQLKYNRNKLGR
ncbi:MAG: hypothetical protein V7788_10340 [Alphaproteobacteria bacterium]|jgi:hypothetical protein